MQKRNLFNRYIPKLADFGLLRHGVSGEGQTATNTMNIAGTHLFMAPEANRGDVSAKMDVWSYGVVLLEILTNLPMFDRTRYVSLSYQSGKFHIEIH